MFKFLKYKRKIFNLPAFSIVEIITVTFIVSLGLVSTVGLAVQNIQAQSINNDNLVAYQLAQEILELARAKRDTNWLQHDDWSTGLESGNYCLDYRNLDPVAVVSVNNCPLYLDHNNRYYTPTSETSPEDLNLSKFSRILEIHMATSSALVRAVVSWTGRNNLAQNYTVETELYDWY